MNVSLKKYMAVSLCVLAAFASGCQQEEIAENTAVVDRLVSDVSVPTSAIYPVSVPSLVIPGTGFLKDDDIRLEQDGGVSVRLEILAVDDVSVTLDLGGDYASGEYRLVLYRGERSQLLGVISLRQSASLDVEDKEGMTVKGVVFCGQMAVEGAVVSDGISVTETDKDGKYWLDSDKRHGYVFISIPTGYEVENGENGFPKFYQELQYDASTCEQVNFELIESPVKDGTPYALLAMTDIHLTDRKDITNPFLYERTKFMDGFAQDARQYVTSLKSSGIPVFAVNLGDLTTDQFWPGYDLNDYVGDFRTAALGCQTFNIPGNHDNDPYILGDFDAEAPFKKIIGPTYYSFNIGGIHYLMLDNVVYKNNGATGSSPGDYSHDNQLTPEQWTWLEADLGKVGDKEKPLVICMHCPMYTYSTENGTDRFDISYAMKANASAQLESMLTDMGFKNVHVLTGHIHANYGVEKTISGTYSIYEHNISSVCATWWWTDRFYETVSIGKDGSPGGYGVFEFNGSDFPVKWDYKSIGAAEHARRFRTYDMNTVKRYLSTDPDAQKLYIRYAGRRADYDAVKDNSVLINVWTWDSGTTVEVTEGGKSLEVKHLCLKDPLHVYAYDIPRVNETQSNTYTESLASGPVYHMFVVETSSATSTLQIKVTDRFGNSETETMTRPKAFNETIF